MGIFYIKVILIKFTVKSIAGVKKIICSTEDFIAHCIEVGYIEVPLYIDITGDSLLC